jgi:hypothetical protein
MSYGAVRQLPEGFLAHSRQWPILVSDLTHGRVGRFFISTTNNDRSDIAGCPVVAPSFNVLGTISTCILLPLPVRRGLAIKPHR